MPHPRTLDELERTKSWRALAQASDPNGLRAFARRYLAGMRVQQFAPQTVALRAFYLLRFILWCEERGITAPGEVTHITVERFQAHLFHYRKKNGEPSTAIWQLGFLMGVQSFFRWMVQRHYIPFNPASDIELPKIPLRRLPEVLTEAEVERALALLDPAVPVELRDRAMWEVLYSTGLRRAELTKLRVQDIDRGRGTLFVRQGKGNKDRTVPIGERALAWVDKYIDELRGEWLTEPGDDRLFLNPDGTAPTLAVLTYRARALFKFAGIDKPGACHLFRHTMATHMLEHGADVRYVQEMLGHSHLGTTQLYTHVSIAKLKAVHTATHPKARLARKLAVPLDDAIDPASCEPQPISRRRGPLRTRPLRPKKSPPQSAPEQTDDATPAA